MCADKFHWCRSTAKWLSPQHIRVSRYPTRLWAIPTSFRLAWTSKLTISWFISLESAKLLLVSNRSVVIFLCHLEVWRTILSIYSFGSSSRGKIQLMRRWHCGSTEDQVWFQIAHLWGWANTRKGTSSMKGLFHGTGPCSVNADSTTTTLNPHSWNNEANVM